MPQELHSNQSNTLALGAICATIGAIISFLARNASNTNEIAGLGLGILLLVIGIAGLVINERRSITIGKDEIRLDVHTSFGKSSTTIQKSDIIRTFLWLGGKPVAGTRYYDIALELKSGKTIYLMGGCVFENRMDKAWMRNLQNQIKPNSDSSGT